MHKNAKDLTGKQFGRLTVLYENGRSKNGYILWHCICNCLERNEIDVPSLRLLNGETQSCGCYRKENTQKIQEIYTRKHNHYDIQDEICIGQTFNSNTKFIVDKDDYEKIKEYCWYESSGGYIVAVKRKEEGNGLHHLHRMIMDLKDKFLEVDHINGNLKDNRKQNLRIVPHIRNSENHSIAQNNTSGFTGVTFNEKNGTWVARIGHNKKRIYLGSFQTFEDAVKARKQAEEKYFGEYARDINYR